VRERDECKAVHSTQFEDVMQFEILPDMIKIEKLNDDVCKVNVIFFQNIDIIILAEKILLFEVKQH